MRVVSENFVFKNQKVPREYTFENVEMILKVYGQKPKRIIGETKEQIYKELLSKNHLRKNTLFITDNIVFKLYDFDYTNWHKGEPIEERFILTLDIDKGQTEKLRKKNSQNSLEGE